VDKSIQIMQPPNAWQAVVQGAVMKGLANSAPESLTLVKVQNRKARKHYGTEWRTKFDDRVHAHISDKKSWSGMEGYYKVNAMEWFIRKVRYFDFFFRLTYPLFLLLPLHFICHQLTL
jgi:hypothetical protein